MASRFDEASTAGQRALNFARSRRQRGEEAVALRVLGEIATHPDRFDAERALEIVGQSGLAAMYPGVAVNVARALARAGRMDRALHLAADAAERAPHTARYHLGYVLRTVAETYVCAGRTEDARVVLRQAVEFARQHSERANQAYALWLLAEVAAASQPVDAAEALARFCESRTLATEIGMCPLVAHCALGLGRLYRQTGEQRQADDHFAAAKRMYREMEMTFWLERAEQEL